MSFFFFFIKIPVPVEEQDDFLTIAIDRTERGDELKRVVTERKK